MKVLLAHTPEMRRNYYGDRSLNGLRAVADVVLHEGDQALDSTNLVNAAKDADIIVADRMTAGPVCAPSFAVPSISATSMSMPPRKPACW